MIYGTKQKLPLWMQFIYIYIEVARGVLLTNILSKESIYVIPKDIVRTYILGISHQFISKD